MVVHWRVYPYARTSHDKHITAPVNGYGAKLGTDDTITSVMMAADKVIDYLRTDNASLSSEG
jgi:hypothetical protein